MNSKDLRRGFAWGTKWILANTLAWAGVWGFVWGVIPSGQLPWAETLFTSTITAPIFGGAVGALVGIWLGLMQSPVLQRWIPSRRWWILMCSTSCAVGGAIAWFVAFPIGDKVGISARDNVCLAGLVVAGILVVLAQWFAARRRLQRPKRVVLVSALNLAVGGSVGLFLTFPAIVGAGWSLAEIDATLLRSVATFAVGGAVGGAIAGTVGGVITGVLISVSLPVESDRGNSDEYNALEA
jgi:hypothetical protein